MPEAPPPVAGSRSRPPHARLHPISRRHLDALTGELGILQHVQGSEADPVHGYCVDDVARALEVDLLHARAIGWPAVAESAWRSVRFLEAAFDEATGRFGSVRAIDGSWSPDPASSDSFGRAMLGLGLAVASAPEPAIVERANALLDRALPKAARLTSPRAQASLILACAAAPDPARTALMRRLATELHARFVSYARPGWPWPEPVVNSENALLPRALIVAGGALGARTMLGIGLQVLDWLIDTQTAPAGHLSPIGNGWWPFRGTRSQFDQQPIEVSALLLASEAALAATSLPRYADAMERAYAWFLGANDLRLQLADPARGACCDGLTPTGVNTNEGAESTLTWLIAAEHIRFLRSADALPEPPRAVHQPSRPLRRPGSHDARTLPATVSPTGLATSSSTGPPTRVARHGRDGATG